MGSKSGNSGKPKSRKMNYEDDCNPVAFANEIAAMQDLAKTGKKSGNKKEEVQMKEVKETMVQESVEEVTTTTEKSAEVKAVEPASAPNTQFAQMADQIKELLDKGISLEEALKQAMPKKVVAPRPTSVDRIALMQEENNIESLRKRIKIAFAKKSKAKGTASEDRYQTEIQEGQARLNELLAEINKADDPIAKALELGEAKGTILQMLIKRLEERADISLEDYRVDKNLSAKALKEKINSQGIDPVPEAIAEEFDHYDPAFLAIFSDRAKRNDQRCQTLVRKYNLLATRE